MGWKKTVLFSVLILIVGTGFTYLIFTTEPEAQRSGATKKTAILVDVTSVEKGTFTPQFRAVGSVQSSQDIIIRPRVAGEVIEHSDNFTPGGMVNKGDTLLQLDQEDYKYALQQRLSEREQAVANLNIEMGLQDVSQKEYQLYDTTDFSRKSLTPEQKKLFLRQPQLQSAKADVDLAQAAVDQAQLQLRRTTITAPFDATVMSRNVNIGSQVSAGDNLGRLTGTQEYWVEVSMPVSKVQWLEFPEADEERGKRVEISNRTAWLDAQQRTGYLYKLISSLENQTRMARVLITVSDPLLRKNNQAVQPPLMLGSFVEAVIPGKEVENIIRLNRDCIRSNNTVWVMKDEQLAINKLDILLRDENYAYVQGGLTNGARVITSDISTVSEGVPLRLNNSSNTDVQ